MIKKRSTLKAFTLVELLVVMAIISIVTSLCILGFKSLTGSTGLTGAGDQMTELLAFARQEAIAKNTITAVVFVTAPGTGSAAYRTASVWELILPVDGTAPSSSNWVQASKWRTLPTGIVIDSSTTESSFLGAPSLPAPLPTINYLGTSLNPTTDCKTQIFLPSGRLNPPPVDPCKLRLVEGFYTGTTLTYQHPSASTPGQPANYVSYIFSTATGEPKVVRP